MEEDSSGTAEVAGAGWAAGAEGAAGAGWAAGSTFPCIPESESFALKKVVHLPFQKPGLPSSEALRIRVTLGLNELIVCVTGRGVSDKNGLVRLSHEVLSQFLLLVPILVVYHECVPQEDGVALQPVICLECQAVSVLLSPCLPFGLGRDESN